MPEDEREQLEEGGERGSNRVAWFVIGAAIGAALAILYAPKSGKDARQVITDKTQQGKDAVTGAGKDFVDSGRQMFDKGRKIVEDAADLFDRARKLVRG